MCSKAVLLCVGLIDDANDFPGCSRFALHYVALSYEERVASYSSGLWCVTGLHRQMRTYIGVHARSRLRGYCHALVREHVFNCRGNIVLYTRCVMKNIRVKRTLSSPIT